MCRSLRALLLGLAMAATAAEAQAVNIYSVEWDGTLGNQFDPGEAGDAAYQSLQTLGSTWGQGMSLPNLTVDFSSDKAFQIVLSGAGGQAIQVVPPTPPDTYNHQHELVVSLSSFTTLNGEFIAGTMDGFSFTDLQGTAPALDYGDFAYGSSSYIGGTNPQFSAYVILGLSGPISFTSLTLDFTAPDAMSLALNDVTPVAGIYVRSQGDFDSGEVSDPGPWVSLVPEPSGIALAAVGLIALLGVIRRARLT